MGFLAKEARRQGATVDLVLRPNPDKLRRPLVKVDHDILQAIFPQLSREMNAVAPGVLAKLIRKAVWRRAKREMARLREAREPLSVIWDDAKPNAVKHWMFENGLVTSCEWSACGRDFWTHNVKTDLNGSTTITCKHCLRLIEKLGGPPTVPTPNQASDQPTVTTVSDNPFYRLEATLPTS